MKWAACCHINECDMSELIPKKRKKADQKAEDDPWLFNKVSTDDNDKRNMFAEVMAISVKIVMNSHVYKFDDKLILQKDEGGMGVELTGVLADIKMLTWVVTLKEKLVTLNI